MPTKSEIANFLIIRDIIVTKQTTDVSDIDIDSIRRNGDFFKVVDWLKEQSK